MAINEIIQKTFETRRNLFFFLIYGPITFFLYHLAVSIKFIPFYQRKTVATIRNKEIEQEGGRGARGEGINYLYQKVHQTRTSTGLQPGKSIVKQCYYYIIV